ncbi:Copper amine oxidase N-terminal domain-containing protein [Paenibacillus sp. 1_12]|uniref:stalk domain-containing protein n=1 Tax=Paenibacillus sp. 1_12 TaxID=1566278 RepID=UPI0008F00565|nr:stalk domain-containing protein [Paenibacillus sp. 1_12]SFM51277.1 Copper amine oxidase N-terminal domain-containing protein [Paenibacillus sp. 1_12]
MGSMKKFYSILIILAVSSFSIVSGANAASKEFDLSVKGEANYKVFVPNYIGTKTVQEKVDSSYNRKRNIVEYRDHVVNVISTPKKDSHGNYPFFEIITDDKNANFVSIWVDVINYDGLDNFFYMAGYQKSDFKNGKVQVSPSFSTPGLEFTDYAGKTFEQVAGELKYINSNAIFTVNFSVNDKNGREVKKDSIKFVFADNGLVKVSPTTSSVVVNGKNISFEAYNVGGNNYFKLRDIAMAVNNTEKQFEVGWDKEKNAINLIPNLAYTLVGGELEVKTKSGSKDAKSSNSKIYLDGEEVQITAYNIDGNNHFKLRDIGKAFNIGVTWDGASKTVGINTNIDYTEETLTPTEESSSVSLKRLTIDEIITKSKEVVNEMGYIVKERIIVVEDSNAPYIGISKDGYADFGLITIPEYSYEGYKDEKLEEFASLSLYSFASDETALNFSVKWLNTMGFVVNGDFKDELKTFWKENKDKSTKKTITKGNIVLVVGTNGRGSGLGLVLYYSE